MGTSLGRLVGAAGNAYLDEQEARRQRARQSQMDATAAQDRQAAIVDRRSALSRLSEMDAYKRGQDTKEEAIKEADRKLFPEMFKKARAGDEEALGWVLDRYPQMATALTKPEPPDKKEVHDGQIVDVKTATAVPIKGFKVAPKSDPFARLIQSQAFSAAQGAKRSYDATLADRPAAQKPVMDAMTGMMVDPVATADKRTAYSADSTAKAEDLRATDATARAMGAPSVLPVHLRPAKSEKPERPAMAPKRPAGVSDEKWNRYLAYLKQRTQAP